MASREVGFVVDDEKTSMSYQALNLVIQIRILGAKAPKSPLSQ